VVLGSSKLTLEFCGANPKPSSGTRFESMSMQTLIVEVQNLIKIKIKR
jgi:hypothetical protein